MTWKCNTKVFIGLLILIVVIGGSYFGYSAYSQNKRISQKIATRDELASVYTKLSTSGVQNISHDSLKLNLQDTNERLIDDDISQLKGQIQQQLATLSHQIATNTDLLNERLELAHTIGIADSQTNLDSSTQSQPAVENTGFSYTDRLSVESAQSQSESLLRALEITDKSLDDINAKITSLFQQRKDAGEFANPLWLIDKAQIHDYVTAMSNEDLVGQLMISGVTSTQLDMAQKSLFEDLKPSGVILMGPNVVSPEQTKTFNSALQNTDSALPLFITVDQEGGPVARVTWDPTSGKTAWNILSDDELCQLAKQRSDILHTAGFNVNFSPVSDLSYTDSNAFINNRTISQDQAVVSHKTEIYSRCHQQGAVSTTLKHFPGHGMVFEDSHKVVPKNDTITLEQWKSSDGIPFINNTRSDFIMAGHLIITKVDSKPASMSSVWLNDILRNQLGYTGLIITDDMKQYQNISGEDISSASLNALKAGVDQLLYVLPPQEVTEIKTNLVNSMIQEQLREIFAEKVLRVLLQKQQLT